MGAAEHERCQIFIMDGVEGKRTFGICGTRCIGDQIGSCHFLNLGGHESRDNTDNSKSHARLECLNMSKELPVVCMVVNPILLIMCVQALVGCDGCHHPLRLRVIGATETLNKFEEANHILITADGGKSVGGFKVILQGWGALMEDNDIGFRHIFLVFVFAILGLVMLMLPKVEVNFCDGQNL